MALFVHKFKCLLNVELIAFLPFTAFEKFLALLQEFYDPRILAILLDKGLFMLGAKLVELREKQFIVIGEYSLLIIQRLDLGFIVARSEAQGHGQ